ncbi:MAG: DUF5711 family protein [Candidatus Pseudoruminococcus sp.]|uniref:DUF5711 family protein n=1 Tax=Candidatus Pseudoruminococcus sp. TaxID=3101048 RepID=UPI002A783380|nr:DUF5711 family protein [Ruminococcus sp.]MDY2782081.1 DUF5711 family protein [Candidatus Pseudoruminococcus sp.]
MAEKNNRFNEENEKQKRHSSRGERHAAAKEKNVADRQVVSYEDVPIDKYDEPAPIQPELIKKLLKVLLIIFGCVILLLVILNWEKLSPDNVSRFIQYDLLGISQGDGYPTSINGNEIADGNFALMDEKTPVYVSDTSIVLLNDNAGQRQNLGNAFAKPILRTSRDYSMVFNAGGTGIRIFSHSNEVYNISLKNKIFCADISASGVFAAVTQSGDYLAKLNVYSKDNKEKYAYSFADYYINNISLNSDGTRAIVSGISAQKGSLVSAVYILDFSQEAYIAKYELKDNSIYDVKFFDNGNAVAIGKNESYFFDIENNKKNLISYDSKTITNYDISNEKGIALSLAKYPDGRDCDIVTISTDGKTTATISTDIKVESISNADKTVAVSFGDTIYLYDKESGKLVDQKKCEQTLKKIAMANDNIVYALGATEVIKTEMNTTVK